MVGSLAPSSKFLASKMLNHLALKNASLIIELGPGTGALTKYIIKNKGPKTQLLIIELNLDFYQNILEKYCGENIEIIHGSATDLSSILVEKGLPHADYIISSLPLANLPSEIRQQILQVSQDCLAKKGKFIQYQYSLQSKKILNEIFKEVHINFTPFNLPPAFIYTCIK